MTTMNLQWKPTLTLLIATASGLLLGQLALASSPGPLELPLTFEENRGQAPADIGFLGRSPGFTVELGEQEAVLATGSERLTLYPEGGRLGRPRAEAPLPGRVHDLTGSQPLTDIPTWARVVYPSVYPGIDLAWEGGEPSWVVGPGASVQQIAVTCSAPLELDARGQLRVDGRLQPPLRAQQGGTQLTATYQLRGPHTVGVSLGRYDRRKALVIETPLSPGERETPLQVSCDQSGGTWLAGPSSVTRLQGSVLLHTTYLDGEVTDLTVDAQGRACVVGQSPAGDAFVTRLTPEGDGLVCRAVLGGQGLDRARAVALDPAGNAYVTGETDSCDFPTRRAYQATHASGRDAFVAKLDPQGALLYSTFLGGDGDDVGSCVAVDEQGHAYVGGTTLSADFPTYGAFQPRLAGVEDGFVVRLGPTGGALAYSTYLGGSACDCVSALTLDEEGQVYLVGSTDSPDFPTSLGAYKSERPGGLDAFVTRLNATGSGLGFSSYLGEPGRQDRACEVDLSRRGRLSIVGMAGSEVFVNVLESDGTFCYAD